MVPSHKQNPTLLDRRLQPFGGSGSPFSPLSRHSANKLRESGSCKIMATSCGLVSDYSVLVCHGGPRPFPIQKLERFRAGDFAPIKLVRSASTGGLYMENNNFSMYATSKGSNYVWEFDEKYPPDSSWVDSFKQAIRVLKMMLVFLAEQPSQLMYIEWPSFQSTLKTAALTLVLVSLLIVALSSIDAALAYLLAVLFRGTG
ncbi:hypothetical protein Dimus_002800 [Dionaea muscipula]